jgi:Winged helix-turn helix
MSAPIPLRQDFDASQLRGLARRSKDGPQARRLLALAAIYDGATRTEAAKIGGVGLQIIRDWVLRFNARGPDALVNGKSGAMNFRGIPHHDRQTDAQPGATRHGLPQSARPRHYAQAAYLGGRVTSPAPQPLSTAASKRRPLEQGTSTNETWRWPRIDRTRRDPHIE